MGAPGLCRGTRTAQSTSRPLPKGGTRGARAGSLNCAAPDLVQRDPDCTVTVATAGILGRAGDMFGAGPEYVRLELLMRWPEFLMLAQKLAVLASN